MDNSQMSYVARKPCGCIVAAISADWDNKELAKEMASWVKGGFTVDRVADEVVRAEFVGRKCPHVEPEPTQQLLF